MTPEEYRHYESNRQRIISANRSRRFRGKVSELEIVPPRLPRPQRVQLYDVDGNYIGTWPYGVSKAEAWNEASIAGERPCTVKMVDCF